jgi:hypothetical protein
LRPVATAYAETPPNASTTSTNDFMPHGYITGPAASTHNVAISAAT